MENSENISHITILAASIEKMYNKARVDGKLHPTDLYLLEAVNKFLSSCASSLTHFQRQTLVALYTNILNNSDTLCRLINITPSIVQKKSSFFQNNSTAPIPGIFDTPFNNVFN